MRIFLPDGGNCQQHGADQPAGQRVGRPHPDVLLAAVVGEAQREAHATGLPTLMKDFIVDEAQLECARHNGTSAVLLIERVVGPARREATPLRARVNP